MENVSDFPLLRAFSFFIGIDTFATSSSLRTLSAQPTPTRTASDGAASDSTSAVDVFRATPSIGAADIASACAQDVEPTHPGGAWLRSSPHASLTSVPWIAEPSIFTGPAPEPLPGRNFVHDAAQLRLAVTLTCSAESQRPLSWTFRRVSLCCSVPAPVNEIV